MSYIHRHVDRRARCAVKLVGRELTFMYRRTMTQRVIGLLTFTAPTAIATRTVTLDFDAVQCRVDVDGQGVRWCVVNSGQAILVREDTGEQVVIATEGIGAGWAHVRALEAGCEVYLMQDGGVRVYHERGWFKHRLEMHQASEGIHHIEDDGTPVSEDSTRNLTPAQRALLHEYMTDEQRLRDPFMYCIDAHHGALLGQQNSPHLGFFRDGQLFDLHPATPTQQSSFFGIPDDGGDPWFAAPGENTPEPDEFRLALKAPAPTTDPPPPPTPPSPTVPTVPPGDTTPVPPAEPPAPPAEPKPSNPPEPQEPSVRARWDAYWSTFGRLKPPAWLRRAYERVSAPPPIPEERRD